MAATDPVHNGDASLAVTYDNEWAGLYLHHDATDTTPFAAVTFALHPTGAAFPNLRAALYNEAGESLQHVDPTDYATPTEGGWYVVTIPLVDLGASATVVTGVQLQDASGAPQPTFHLDSFKLTRLDE